jgi:hypothetical protein
MSSREWSEVPLLDGGVKEYGEILLRCRTDKTEREEYVLHSTVQYSLCQLGSTDGHKNQSSIPARW